MYCDNARLCSTVEVVAMYGMGLTRLLLELLLVEEVVVAAAEVADAVTTDVAAFDF